MPELRRRRWEIRSQHGAEQAGLELGIEVRRLDAIRSGDVAVLVLQAPDQAVETESPQVVGHLRSRIRGAEQTGYQGTEAPVGEAGDGVEVDAEGADQSHDSFVPEAQ